MEMSKKILGTAVLLVAGLSQSSAYAVSCTDSQGGYSLLYCNTPTIWVTTKKNFRIIGGAYYTRNNGTTYGRQGTFIVTKKRDWQSDVNIYNSPFTGSVDKNIPTSGQANYYAYVGADNYFDLPAGTKETHVGASLTAF
jgi:hypothetical protein